MILFSDKIFKKNQKLTILMSWLLDLPDLESTTLSKHFISLDLIIHFNRIQNISLLENLFYKSRTEEEVLSLYP
jgi:hypothetical protein